MKKKSPRNHLFFRSMMAMTIALLLAHPGARAEEKPSGIAPPAATQAATQAEQPAQKCSGAAAQPAAAAEEGEYEIDYEEEPGDSDEVEKPTPAKPVRGKKSAETKQANANGGSGGIQGSRAKHRFTPVLKSETKSIYQKDGKSLDVDSD